MIELLQRIAAEQRELNILSVYKGLSISNPAPILEVGDTFVRVKIDQYLAVALFNDKFAFLQSSELPEIVRADVAKLDLARQCASLDNFQYAPDGVGQRRMVRVKPRTPLNSDLKDQRYLRSVRGELADISQEGIAIYLPGAEFKSWQFSPGTETIITLRLPGEYITHAKKTGSLPSNIPIDRSARRSSRSSLPETTSLSASRSDPVPRIIDPQIQLRAIVKHVRLEPAHSRYRVGLQIGPDAESRALLSQFISHRQTEIIREIRWMYDLLAQNLE